MFKDWIKRLAGTADLESKVNALDGEVKRLEGEVKTLREELAAHKEGYAEDFNLQAKRIRLIEDEVFDTTEIPRKDKDEEEE